MTNKLKNPKSDRIENKRNDIKRPEDKKGNNEIPPVFENFNGKPIK